MTGLSVANVTPTRPTIRCSSEILSVLQRPFKPF